MTNRRISMHEYRHAISRMKQGESDRAIARAGLLGRVKAKLLRALAAVKGWLNPDSALPGEEEIAKVLDESKKARPTQAAKAFQYAERIESWATQGVSAKVIHQKLVTEHQYQGSYSSVQRFVKQIRGNEPDVTVPLQYAAGEAVQVDFGQGPMLYDKGLGGEKRTWFFVMTLCWSRHQYAELVWDQKVPTWLGCHRRAFEWFGGIPKRVIIDNAKCAIIKACYYEPTVQRAYADCAEGYGFIIQVVVGF